MFSGHIMPHVQITWHVAMVIMCNYRNLHAPMMWRETLYTENNDDYDNNTI